MPQVNRRLTFHVINRRHQFRFQPDVVLAMLSRFSCNSRPVARVMCLKKRDWVAESSQFEPMVELSNETSTGLEEAFAAPERARTYHIY